MQQQQEGNAERKARKEAQKATKAALLAEKKQQQKSEQPASKKKTPHRNDPASQPIEVQLSRALSYILRHGALKEGLTIRQDGYILLEAVLARPRVRSINMGQDGKSRKASLEDIQSIVASNEKQRFEIKQEEEGVWWIRAVQGHSIKEVKEVGHTELTLDNLSLLKGGQEGEVMVIHGTNEKAWQLILQSGGLSTMTRNHIHLAKGKLGDEGVISGMRKSSSRLIFVDIRAALSDDISFLLSSNGVVLTPGLDGVLPRKYFVRVEDQSGKVIWE